MELGSSCGFGEVVCNHIISGTELYCQIVLIHLVLHEEVPYIDVASTVRRACFAILFKEDGTPVVLVEDILLYIKHLCFHNTIPIVPLSTVTSLASVELLLFGFCFLLADNTDPSPKVKDPPV